MRAESLQQPNTPSNSEKKMLHLKLRQSHETSKDSNRFHQTFREKTWNPEKTAIIICDMWDAHHSVNAVRRLKEFAPRLNEVLQTARQWGTTIIHSPSDCMDYYKEHPARRNALKTPVAENPPVDIASWCHRIPGEESAVYPIDQSDGGEDDDLVEHAQWAGHLKRMGRNPGTPWIKQTDVLKIQKDDFICSEGDLVWNILRNESIENVILVGVHTNMCVLGRPFGLRQMVRNGLNTVLMRDMTDIMYNPARWPYISHFSGIDLIVDHIERHVCPTITSDQLIGGKPFRFKNDLRPHLVILMAEQEYLTLETLPEFASTELQKDFRISYIYADETDRNHLPGLEILEQADLLLVSVRRRAIPENQLNRIRNFVATGRSVIGIRTASHAFDIRGAEVKTGHDIWEQFDADVLGGNYHNHHGNNGPGKPRTLVRINQKNSWHPILTGLKSPNESSVQSSLYKTSPVSESATILMTGRVEGRQPEEPVSWSFTRADGGRSFYTSLGHPNDFKWTDFRTLLRNAVYWAANRHIPEISIANKPEVEGFWQACHISTTESVKNSADASFEGNLPTRWFRCLILIPENWKNQDLRLDLTASGADIHFNGNRLSSAMIPPEWVEPGKLNLLAIRIPESQGFSPEGSMTISNSKTKTKIDLQGNWQMKTDDNPALATFPIPPQFGASTDIIFE
ncbi:MAG TPA: nicotinamidase [Verrucomicrobiales bacterium]|nr:nicotinamidase [Verrucomicrobiales bacterium]HIL70932.1 nicotinamidase [Verrucomicrobiota bacterium]